jgi:hypothetical protein
MLHHGLPGGAPAAAGCGSFYNAEQGDIDDLRRRLLQGTPAGTM